MWEEKPLFPDRIDAWANGPVVPSLYRHHRGQFQVRTWAPGNPRSLNGGEIGTIEAVLRTYGDKPADWLSALTHREPPWLNARQGLADGERGHRLITKDAMAEYYGGLVLTRHPRIGRKRATYRVDPPTGKQPRVVEEPGDKNDARIGWRMGDADWVDLGRGVRSTRSGSPTY